MEIQQINQGQFQLQKCPIHEFKEIDLIDLTGISKNVQMCFLCARKNEIDLENMLSLQEIYAYKKGDILISFPPLKDKRTKNSLENLQKLSMKEVLGFFKTLRIEMEEAISLAEESAKQSFIIFQQMRQKVYQEWSGIAEIEKLKEFLAQNNENLNRFLKDKWDNAEINTNKMCMFAEEIDKNLIDFDEKQQEVRRLVQSIKEFELFDQIYIPILKPVQRNQISIIQNLTLKFSTFPSSQFFTLIKTSQHFLQMKNNSSSENDGEAFLDLVLHPQKKYIIRLNYQRKSKEQGSHYDRHFGFISHGKEFDARAFKIQVYNFEDNPSFKCIKKNQGNNLDNPIRDKEAFEVRICIKEKILKIASFPDYSQIIECSSNHINKAYELSIGNFTRFFIHMRNQKDVFEINEVLEVEEFNDPVF